jgi:hypothetical protein
VTVIVKPGDWQPPTLHDPLRKAVLKRLPSAVCNALAVLAVITLGAALVLAVLLMLAALNWLIPPMW